MPFSEQSREDLSWTLKEIVEGGGDGSISEAQFVEGLTDEQIVALFRNARKADYEKKKYPVTNSDSFQQTLIYSGKVGDKINVGYREFSSNVARPAFNNEVEYDLSESKIIGYKGARIEVIEATNEYIKYKTRYYSY